MRRKEKQNVTAVNNNEKKKLKKARLYFIGGCFTKPFKVIYIYTFFFFISQGHSQRNFYFSILGISKEETGSNK